MKTAEETNDHPTPPPTDREVMKTFIADADALAVSMTSMDPGLPEYHVIKGHVEARRLLAEELDTAREARAAFVKDAGDRVVKAATEAGEKISGLIQSWYAKAEAQADQDRR